MIIFATDKTKVVTKAATKVQRKIETTKEKAKKVIMCKTETAGIQIPETQIEKERRERNEAICKEFTDLAPKVVEQGYKPYRAITMIAEKYRKTPAGIISILQNAGLYTNSKEYVESIQNTEAENAQQENE